MYSSQSTRVSFCGKYWRILLSAKKPIAILNFGFILGALNATACPRGTINKNVGGASLADCYPCLPGKYCDAVGATQPTGKSWLLPFTEILLWRQM